MGIDIISMKPLHCMDDPVLARGFMRPVQYYHLVSVMLQDPFWYARRSNLQHHKEFYLSTYPYNSSR